MSDTEEPPTKLTKMENASIDSAEEGQEEWLSDGILTDEEYTVNESAVNNTSQDETMASLVEETQQIDDIEDTLNNLDSSCATDNDDLDKFLIRKAEAKADKMDEDCNSTEDLLRLLGEKEEKPVKVEQKTQPSGDSTTDDEIEDLINPQTGKMQSLKLAKTVLKKASPTKAEPEDSDSDTVEDISNISKITTTSVQSKQAVLRPSKPRGNIAAKSTTSKVPVTQTKEIVQFKVTSQPVSSTPIKKEAPKSQPPRQAKTPYKVENFKITKSLINVEVKQSSKQTPTKQTATRQTPTNQIKLTEVQSKQIEGKNIQIKQITKKDVPIKLMSKKQILSKEIPSTREASNQQPSKVTQIHKIEHLRPGQIKFEPRKSEPSQFNLSKSVELKSEQLKSEQRARVQLPRSAKKVKIEKDAMSFQESLHAKTLNNSLKVKEEMKSTSTQKIMKPEEMDEEGLSDDEDSLSDGSLFDEMRSSEDSDIEDWFTFDIRGERAGDYIHLLGPRAQEMLSEEKGRVTERVSALKQSLAALTASARQQAEQLKSATATLAELDAMLAAA